MVLPLLGRWKWDGCWCCSSSGSSFNQAWTPRDWNILLPACVDFPYWSQEIWWGTSENFLHFVIISDETYQFDVLFRLKHVQTLALLVWRISTGGLLMFWLLGCIRITRMSMNSPTALLKFVGELLYYELLFSVHGIYTDLPLRLWVTSKLFFLFGPAFICFSYNYLFAELSLGCTGWQLFTMMSLGRLFWDPSFQFFRHTAWMLSNYGVDFWFRWQETLLNLLLRNYLHYNLYDQAEKLRSKAPRFEAHSNQQVIIVHQVSYLLSCFYAELLQLK